MSTKIEVQRICEYCGKQFLAKTTVTKYCSHRCNQRDYKAKHRKNKIQKSNKETVEAINRPIERIKAKEFLTVGDVSKLLDCSKRTVYYLIENGKLNAVNLGERMTRIRRSDIDNLF